MWTTLLFGIGLIVLSYEEKIDPSTTTTYCPVCKCNCPSLPFNEEYVLAQIASYSLSREDLEDMTGGALRYGSVKPRYPYKLIEQCTATIGLSELRSELGFEPLPSWKVYNETKPNEEELQGAPSVEAYYNLKEPRTEEGSLNSTLFYENNIISGVVFLDKQLPGIRQIYRRTFQEIRLEKPVDRQIVDQCLKEFARIQRQMVQAKEKMFIRIYERGTWNSIFYT